jgi:hypothetical protein
MEKGIMKLFVIGFALIVIGLRRSTGSLRV